MAGARGPALFGTSLSMSNVFILHVPDMNTSYAATSTAAAAAVI